MTRRTCRIIAFGLFSLFALHTFAGAGRVDAHALYERSNPPSGGQIQTPGSIQVWFTEAIEPSFSKIELLDASRRKVPVTSLAVPGDNRALVLELGQLPEGIYTAAWQTLSAVDGHVVRGVFPVIAGEGGTFESLLEAPAYVPSPRDVLARWLGYVAALALAGGALFMLTVWAPSVRQALAGSNRIAETRRDADSRVVMFSRLAALAYLLATVVGMVSQAANAAEVSFFEAIGAPLAQLLSTRLGLLWEVRLGIGVVLLFILVAARGRVRWLAQVVCASALLGIISLGSHAAAVSSGAWLATALDWIHQLAAAAWVGGLFIFAVLLPRVISRLQAPLAMRLLAALVPRFSRLAIACVIVLGLTGLFHSWLNVTTPAALPETFYGQTLIAKLALILPMLALGGLNLWMASPALARGAAQRVSLVVPSARRLRWSVTAEAILGLLVLLATAALTAAEPARETYARLPRPLTLAGQADDLPLKLVLQPARPGINQFTVQIGDGPAPPEVQRVSIRFTYLDQEYGSGVLNLERKPDGHFSAIAGSLSTDGNWQLEALVRRRGREDARAGFRVNVVAAETAGQAPNLDPVAWIESVGRRYATAYGLMALGLALAFWISRASTTRSQRMTLYASSLTVAGIGLVIYARAVTAPPLPIDVRTLRNPFPPDVGSLIRGRAIYEQQCASCHGAGGRGDGPLAPSLRPRPADFRVHMAAGHSDGELYTWLSKGVPGTAMGAFEGQLSVEDRWHVINFIRGFAEE